MRYRRRMIRLMTLLALTLPVPAAFAQVGAPVVAAPPAQEAAAPAPKPAYKTVPVTLTTSEGAIVLALEVERAPVTAANFLRYVDQKRLDGTLFYRSFTFPERPDIGLVQGGTQHDPKRVLKDIAHEPTGKTGLTHDDGAISMARGAPGTANGDFFIIIGEMKGLDADPKASGDNQGFAVFGHVTSGMEVVRKIAIAPKNPAAGVGAMKGQMLARPVKILTARRGE
jgi:peptidyl-prolyl cis-trans isomerase A (cyclophilin A)